MYGGTAAGTSARESWLRAFVKDMESSELALVATTACHAASEESSAFLAQVMIDALEGGGVERITDRMKESLQGLQSSIGPQGRSAEMQCEVGMLQSNTSDFISGLRLKELI